MKTQNSYAVQLIVLALGVIPLTSAVRAAHPVTHVKLAEGQVVTGANRWLGEPLYSYDFAANPTFGFNTVDELDPGQTLPNPLSPASNRDVVLATTFANLAAVPPDVLPNVNIALRDVGTFVNGLLVRQKVPFQLDPGAPVIGPTQAGPGNPDRITLRDWMTGRGLAISRCGPRGNYASIFVSHLIPNRMYTALALWLNEDGTFRPVALGGVPNVIMTDPNGTGSLTRELNFCPEDAARDGVGADHLIAIAVIFHSAHVAWGAIPTPAAPGLFFPPGSMVHAHLWFDLGAGRPVAH